MKFFSVVLVGFALASGGFCQAARVQPKDEAARLADFNRARNRFVEALKRRSVSGVLAFVDGNTAVQTEGATEMGKAAFRREWHLDDPKSGFWERTLLLLANGSAGGLECKPARGFCQVIVPFWAGSDSEIDEAVILGANIPAYRRPDTTSQQITRLSYDMVRIESTTEPAVDESQWIHVQLPAGGTGFVEAKYVYRAIDPMLGFRRDDAGNWRISGLTAAD